MIFNFFKKPKRKKMYVLVRLDLSENYRMVQGSHALSQYALNYSEKFNEWRNQTIVFLAVQNLRALRYWMRKLNKNHKIYSVFYEPDIDLQQTAVACYDDGIIFKKLKTV